MTATETTMATAAAPEAIACADAAARPFHRGGLRRSRAAALAAVGATLAADGIANVVAAFAPARHGPSPSAAAAGAPRSRLAYAWSQDDVGTRGGKNETIFDTAAAEGPSLGGSGLIRERERAHGDAARPAKSKSLPPKAVEPAASKPSEAFLSPIQTMKKVPKVEPVRKSTVFFLNLEQWQRTDPNAEAAPKKTPAIQNKPTWSGPNADQATAKKPAIRNWKTQVRASTAFAATSYLDSLGPAAGTSVSDSEGNGDGNSDGALLQSLRDQEGRRRDAKRRAQNEAARLAARRTSPKAAVEARRAAAEARRQAEERDSLARQYAERQDRLAAREAADAAKKGAAPGRSVPVFERASGDAPPLLIGETLTFQWGALTPSQKRAVEAARSRHREHNSQIAPLCSEGESKSGPSGLPIIAVLDGYTGAVQSSKGKRYATFASIKTVESNGEEGPAIELMGVGRVLLYEYFASEEEGLTNNEAELSQIRKRIQMLNEGKEPANAEDDSGNEVDRQLPAVMAEFDPLLDDASTPLSDPHDRSGEPAADLHHAANRVYRLHEDRKRLAAGLRAAAARRRLGTAAAVTAELMEGCLPEIKDCDWRDRLLNDALWGGSAAAKGAPNATAPRDAPKSRLEALENYGLTADDALATLPERTAALMARLAPYRSPAHRGREEYEAEVASFVVLRSLAAYASPEEVAEALTAVPSSTQQRLDWGYRIMLRHRDELTKLAERMSRELAECVTD